MADFPSLVNHLLIAMPSLADPRFERTVTLICQHGPEGAMGVVLNRQSNLTVQHVLEQLDLPVDQTDAIHDPVFLGGPVQTERGLVLHDARYQYASTLPINEHLALTVSRDIMEAISSNQGPSRRMIALGYAGWQSGQLEQEIEQNTWLYVELQETIVFDIPVEQRWRQAALLLGIDIALISSQIGHA
ncbi:MAG TPA: YqgE/AlgH family protein [Gammaproteobacteria bacterium]|nr:YqgE/AlgH family protein [Gammaproteobacteria bacterium]